MEMTIIYIFLIIVLLGILFHIFFHLLTIFHKDTTDLYVKKILEDPHRYVRMEEMCYFFRNMVYLYFVVHLLLVACNDNIKIEKNTKTVTEISIKKYR